MRDMFLTELRNYLSWRIDSKVEIDIHDLANRDFDNQIAIWDAVIASYEEEYKYYYDQHRLLDSKAVSAAATSGVFLAAVFAFSRLRPEAAAPWMVYAMVVILLVLVLVLSFCIMSMRVRTVLVRPRGALVHRLAEDLDKLDAKERLERSIVFRKDLARSWVKPVKSLRRSVSKKAGLIAVAQYLLVLGALSIAIAVGAEMLILSPLT